MPVVLSVKVVRLKRVVEGSYRLLIIDTYPSSEDLCTNHFLLVSYYLFSTE
jgi:cellulose biosynthesis protein BcsQ